jgi:polyhydroxybutyrate depolymerase
VPLEGRVIRERWRQGDVFASLAVWRRACEGVPAHAARFAGLSCERTDCAQGRLEVCLHDGGHDLDGSWIAQGAARLLGEGS